MQKTLITTKVISVFDLKKNGVGLQGFEPQQTEPKTVVLPLHHKPMCFLISLQR